MQTAHIFSGRMADCSSSQSERNQGKGLDRHSLVTFAKTCKALFPHGKSPACMTTNDENSDVYLPCFLAWI